MSWSSGRKFAKTGVASLQAGVCGQHASFEQLRTEAAGAPLCAAALAWPRCSAPPQERAARDGATPEDARMHARTHSRAWTQSLTHARTHAGTRTRARAHAGEGMHARTRVGGWGGRGGLETPRQRRREDDG
eukprot:6182664-Pleurochrysis_carterae.AAC.3